MPRSGKVRRVYDNDDAWIMAETKPPLTPDIMWWNMIEPHEGSPVDGWLYSVGGHDVYDYETDIGERTSEAYAERGERRQRNRGDNLRHMIDHHGGPMAVMTEQCHRLGMDFLPSVRMNEHYDIDPDDPAFGKLRREHPELTIGKGVDLPEPSMEWGVGTGLDYALPEVRDYMSSIVLETVERWDVDGVELDFFRHPTHFNIEEAYSNRYLMTDMVEKIRRRMDEIGEVRGKGLDLMVRVPATIERCERLGLDIREWVESYLVDMVVAGGGVIPFEMPVRELVEL
ncbi:MAG: family 10 glycosylhydrolase, partial [Chloroflexota bacterium]|nr:family 10 glycosylhydrolase [Chloroflexota bacterium]